MDKLKQKYIDAAFEIGIAIKGIDAIFEVIGSFAILFVTHDMVVNLVTIFTHSELSEDPKDIIANTLVKFANHFSLSGQIFAFAYLFGHGAIKIFLVICLLRKKLWAYPLSIVVFSLFIIYQLYEFALNQSPWLIALTVFDAIILWLIWREYHFLKKTTSVHI